MTAPDKVCIRERLIRDALAKYGLTNEEFFGRGGAEDMVAARREVAIGLKNAGFRIAAIARILKRKHASVHYYLDPNYARRKRNRMRAICGLRRVSQDIADVVADIAAAEGISPTVLVAEWISERATYEAEAKARAA